MEHSHQTAFAVWITGLPASGKSTLAAQLAGQLGAIGIQVTVLESDALRKMFSTEPRYDEQDRQYFYGSLAFIGRVLTDHGISVIFDATANRRAYCDRARQQIARFIEVLSIVRWTRASGGTRKVFTGKLGRDKPVKFREYKPHTSHQNPPM